MHRPIKSPEKGASPWFEKAKEPKKEPVRKILERGIGFKSSPLQMNSFRKKSRLKEEKIKPAEIINKMKEHKIQQILLQRLVTAILDYIHKNYRQIIPVLSNIPITEWVQEKNNSRIIKKVKPHSGHEQTFKTSENQSPYIKKIVKNKPKKRIIRKQENLNIKSLEEKLSLNGALKFLEMKKTREEELKEKKKKKAKTHSKSPVAGNVKLIDKEVTNARLVPERKGPLSLKVKKPMEQLSSSGTLRTKCQCFGNKKRREQPRQNLKNDGKESDTPITAAHLFYNDNA